MLVDPGNEHRPAPGPRGCGGAYHGHADVGDVTPAVGRVGLPEAPSEASVGAVGVPLLPPARPPDSTASALGPHCPAPS
ncbi:MAG: hypothetical protein GY820_40945, partial [Gammaproteobacteria bacterium]|nr:hypothetical protein [Gammaproteobacteria bacterium]